MGNYNNVKSYRQRQKANIIYVMGGKCACCGYDRCSQALELHHLNPEEKDFTFSKNTNRAWPAITEELPKTILVCANCHREIHAGIIDNSLLVSTYDEVKSTEVTNKFAESKSKHLNYCKICGKEITGKATYCVECSQKLSRKTERPTREVLKKELREMPMLQIGKKYGVSDNAVRKWCDKYNLPRKVSDIKQYTDEEWEKI